MRVFRLTKARYADLSGASGLVRQGRWHTRGQPVVYCGSSRALCALETLVHLESNVLLNPRHPDMRRVRIIGVEPFAFDERLLRGAGNVGS